MQTILIIDDLQSERELFGKFVEKLGHQAEYATDGESGLTKAKTLKPAMILLDVVMPKQDGFATCRKLKKDAETSAIPICIVTSKAQDSDKFWGEKQGCDAYLVKPFVPAELEKVIKKYVR